jgi:hypothetical protein
MGVKAARCKPGEQRQDTDQRGICHPAVADSHNRGWARPNRRALHTLLLAGLLSVKQRTGTARVLVLVFLLRGSAAQQLSTASFRCFESPPHRTTANPLRAAALAATAHTTKKLRLQALLLRLWGRLPSLSSERTAGTSSPLHHVPSITLPEWAPRYQRSLF